jgi:phosphotransferase family enzyme
LVPRAEPYRPAAALQAACFQRGVNASGARLIHHYSNAVFHLPAADLVARVTPGSEAGRRLRDAQRVVDWLVDEHGFPATAPASVDAVDFDGHATVTFWRYYHQPHPTPRPNARDLATLLKRLHTITGAPPVPLTPWVPLASLEAALAKPSSHAVLDPAEHDWLWEEMLRVRDECDHLDYPLGRGLVHGDAWAGNLLWHGSGWLLGDWDWVGWGPREIDLIPTWHAAARYGRGPQWAQAFIDQYGYNLADWSGYPTLMHMRDLAQLPGPLGRADNSDAHRNALRQRLDGIRTSDTSTWTAL